MMKDQSHDYRKKDNVNGHVNSYGGRLKAKVKGDVEERVVLIATKTYRVHNARSVNSIC